MITDVFSFLDRYHHNVPYGRFDDEGHRHVHALFHSEAEELSEAGYIRLYNRLVPVRLRPYLTLPSQVYQNNLRTLCNNAQRFQEALLNITRQELATTQHQLAEEEEKSEKHSNTTSEMMMTRITKAQKKETIYQIHALTEQSILDGSFLLIEDIIAAIDQNKFLFNLNKRAALRTIKSALSLPFLIENNLGNAPKIHESIVAFLNLEKVICAAISQVEKRPIFPETTYSFEVSEYLKNLSTEEPENKELILFVISLNLLEKEQDPKNFMTSIFVNHIVDHNFDKARAVRALQLATDQEFTDNLNLRTYLLLSRHDDIQNNIEQLRHIIAFNNGRSPLNKEALGKALISASEESNTLPLVKFIHDLMGEIPSSIMKKALKEAQHASGDSVSPVLAYLQHQAYLQEQDASSCAIS